MGKKLKIALVHDYIKEYGGAEKVLEELHNTWPNAPIFTTIYQPHYLGPHKERFKDWDIRPSILQHVPLKQKLISPFRLVTPFIFPRIDLDKFDVVIVSATGAYSPNTINKGKAKLFCYCHTPPRYLYGYPTARDWRKNIITRIGGEVSNHFLRIVDFKASQNVDYFISNSKEIADRIKKFYRKDAVVINPPIDIPKLKKPVLKRKRKYFLTGGRLARAKRFDLAIKACNKLGVHLKVFGKSFAGYGGELEKLAGKNIDLLGEVSQEEKLSLIKGAIAYISPSLQEDFGMLNLEVNALGTPVIAYRSGGVLETQKNGKTGVLFDEPTVASVVNAIKRLDKVNIDYDYLIKHAKKFSTERFQKEILDYVNNNA